MAKLFKILGIFIGVVLLLVVAASVILPLVVDPNDFKGEIVKQVKEETGRDLKIAGDLNLSVFPWPRNRTRRQKAVRKRNRIKINRVQLWLDFPSEVSRSKMPWLVGMIASLDKSMR